MCPDCGTPLPKDAALMGLCPQCLLSMALEDEENPTLQGPGPGGILGERYQIREVLGRGGMGGYIGRSTFASVSAASFRSSCQRSRSSSLGTTRTGGGSETLPSIAYCVVFRKNAVRA